MRVCLLISTHSLPPLSYSVPKYLTYAVRIGSMVVAPLKDHSRLGVVVGFENGGNRELQEIRGVREEVSLDSNVIKLCEWVSEMAAVPLATVVRAALPPGLNVVSYKILDPVPGQPWKPDTFVSRATARRELGDEGLIAAEVDGRLELAPLSREPTKTEWAVIVANADPDFGRARRQREVFEELKKRGSACSTSTLLTETGASRETLRNLVRREVVRLEQREAPGVIFRTLSEEREPVTEALSDEVDPVTRGGAWLWRIPTNESAAAAAAVARATLSRQRATIILAPEKSTVEHLVSYLRRILSPGHKVAAYHSGLGRDRMAVYEAARRGDLDVLVGTRTAALVPLKRLGAICVVDEPNDAHRAEPGYEGLPLHVRDVVLKRGEVEEAGVLFLSPYPSLRLYAGKVRVRELPARQPPRWPSIRIVDLRGSGASMSATILEACRGVVEAGGRVGVVANRIGYAAVVSCTRCGSVSRCPRCDLPLVLVNERKLLVCGRCSLRMPMNSKCDQCGSERLSPTGLAVEGVRETLSRALEAPVGLLTAATREREDAPVVVGTARCILDKEWDTVVLPDIDALLLGSGMGAVERAFRLLYGAAEAARGSFFIQTRVPEHYALRAALRGDYPAFAVAELPRLRDLGYPPFGHLADITLEGSETALRRAVESRLRPALGADVEMSGLVPLPNHGRAPQAWRLLLRGRERAAVARAGALAARLASEARSLGALKVKVNIDPEEV